MTTPDAPSREERVLFELERLHAIKTGGGGVLIAGGAAVLFAAGVVFTGLISFLMWNFFGTSIIGFTGWFFLYLIAVAWLLYREHKWMESSFFDGGSAATYDPEDPDSFDDYRLDRADTGESALMQKLLWAPRTLLLGIATVRDKQPTRFKGLLLRSALTILQLYDDKDPIPLPKLIQPGEPPEQFREAIQWLDDNDHIGLSSDQSRAWLSTRMRQHLSHAE